MEEDFPLSRNECNIVSYVILSYLSSDLYETVLLQMPKAGPSGSESRSTRLPPREVHPCSLGARGPCSRTGRGQHLAPAEVAAVPCRRQIVTWRQTLRCLSPRSPERISVACQGQRLRPSS